MFCSMHVFMFHVCVAVHMYLLSVKGGNADDRFKSVDVVRPQKGVLLARF